MNVETTEQKTNRNKFIDQLVNYLIEFATSFVNNLTVLHFYFIKNNETSAENFPFEKPFWNSKFCNLQDHIDLLRIAFYVHRQHQYQYQYRKHLGHRHPNHYRHAIFSIHVKTFYSNFH